MGWIGCVEDGVNGLEGGGGRLEFDIEIPRGFGAWSEPKETLLMARLLLPLPSPEEPPPSKVVV